MNKLDLQELYASEGEEELRSNFVKHFRTCPIPDDDILKNLGLFLNSKNLSRILFFNHLYEQIIDVHGNIMEFGCRWGQNLSLFAALRGIYEPFNRFRKIIGFDTFTGFPEISEFDNSACSVIKEGGLQCTPNYKDYLSKVMDYQEHDNPLAHIKKYDIREGDACIEVEKYLNEFPETIISLAFFDFDIYEPTKKCLRDISSHLVKGSILAFDELNDPDSPGETIALAEIIGLKNIRLKRFRYCSRTSYFVVE